MLLTVANPGRDPLATSEHIRTAHRKNETFTWGSRRMLAEEMRDCARVLSDERAPSSSFSSSSAVTRHPPVTIGPLAAHTGWEP